MMMLSVQPHSQCVRSDSLTDCVTVCTSVAGVVRGPAHIPTCFTQVCLYF